MNLDRLTPKSIRSDSAPVETMMETLESFADATGGPLWRQQRARKTELTRTLTLYIDEDYEMLDPEAREPLREEDGEEIEIIFSAERVAADDDENDLADFSNVYTLTHSVSFPLLNILSMPQEYQEELLAELAIDDDEIDDAEHRLSQTSISSQPDLSDDIAVIETNTTKYTISQEDGSIEYHQHVDYYCGDILINGAEYDSETTSTLVHGDYLDKHNEEYLSHDMGVDEDRIEAVEERILILDDIAAIALNERHRMELLGQSTEEHAVRVLALLSLIGANIRRHKSREDQE